MPSSDTYLALTVVPEQAVIYDCTARQYPTLTRFVPNAVAGLPSLNARDYLRGLADVDPTILTSQSALQISKKLESLAENADMSADSSGPTRADITHLCGTRDNIRQLIALIERASP